MVATRNNNNSNSGNRRQQREGGPCGLPAFLVREKEEPVRWWWWSCRAGINVNNTSAVAAGGAPIRANKVCDQWTGSEVFSLVRCCLRRRRTNMSRNGKSPKLDLRLNLSARRGGSSGLAGGAAGNTQNGVNNNNNNNNSPHHSSSSSSPTSPPSSCVSSETDGGRCSSSPEATSMVLVGCPRCLMYVMLSEDDPKCPKCKSTVLLDFLNDPKNAPATSTAKTRKK